MLSREHGELLIRCQIVSSKAHPHPPWQFSDYATGLGRVSHVFPMAHYAVTGFLLSTLRVLAKTRR
jgi:hypothetical protein